MSYLCFEPSQNQNKYSVFRVYVRDAFWKHSHKTHTVQVWFSRRNTFKLGFAWLCIKSRGVNCFIWCCFKLAKTATALYIFCLLLHACGILILSISLLLLSEERNGAPPCPGSTEQPHRGGGGLLKTCHRVIGTLSIERVVCAPSSWIGTSCGCFDY